MLIICYQCRQQLDVPEDGAGKRVHCPHCQHLIVVPAKKEPAAPEATPGPGLALPIMELEDGTGETAPATQVQAGYPLPARDGGAKASDAIAPKPALALEELPPLPSIDRGPDSAPNRAGVTPNRVGRGVGASVLIFVVMIGIRLLMAFSHRGPAPVVFNPPPPQFNPPQADLDQIIKQKKRPDVGNPWHDPWHRPAGPPGAPGARGEDAHLGQVILEDVSDVNQEGGRPENEYTAVALHPTKPIAVVGTHGAELKIIWLHGEKETRTIATDEVEPIEQICFSANGRWLAVAVGEKIQLWLDWEDEVPFKKRLIPGRRCAFTRNHHLLIVRNDTITEYDPDTIKFAPTLEVPDQNLKGLALSPDGGLLAVYAGPDVFLWRWPQKTAAGRIAAHAGPITAAVFAPDGKTLATAGTDRTIKLWDVRTGQERATMKAHAWTVWNLAFTPDGKHLASAGLDGMLLVWDLQPEQPRLVWGQSHQFPIRSVAWDDEGKQIYFTCKHPSAADPWVHTRQMRKVAWTEVLADPQEAEKLVAERAGLHIASVTGEFFLTPHGQTMATISAWHKHGVAAYKVRLWDAATARVKFEVDAKKEGTLSPDGRWFVFAKPGMQTQMQLIEVKATLVHADRARLDGGDVSTVVFTPDCQSMWVQLKNELVRYEIPALVSKQRLQLHEPGDEVNVKILPSRDGKTFLVSRDSPDTGLRTRTLYASADGTELATPKFAGVERSEFLVLRRKGLPFQLEPLELMDLLRGQNELIGLQAGAMDASAIHPERKLAATGDAGPNRGLKIHFWDLKEHRPILTLPETAARTASAMRFSGDGRLFSCTTSGGWTRVVPMDWLLERRELLPTAANEAFAP